TPLSTRWMSIRRQCGEMVAQPRECLHEALVGAVFLDHPVALGERREHARKGNARPAAEVLERDRGAELHWLDVVAAAVAIDDARADHCGRVVRQFEAIFCRHASFPSFSFSSASLLVLLRAARADSLRDDRGAPPKNGGSLRASRRCS